MSTFWSHHWAAPAAPAQPPQPRSAYRPARLIFGANRAYPCPISPKRMRHRLGLDASEWSDLAVLATLSFYKNEPRSISFRSLPKDGGLVVIKTRPSRGSTCPNCLLPSRQLIGYRAPASAISHFVSCSRISSNSWRRSSLDFG